MAANSVTRTTRSKNGNITSPLPADLLRKLEMADRFTVQNIADWGGPFYLNPLLGYDEKETFSNIESIMQLMHEILDPEKNLDMGEAQHGLRLVMQLVWGAAQFRANRLSSIEGSAA